MNKQIRSLPVILLLNGVVVVVTVVVIIVVAMLVVIVVVVVFGTNSNTQTAIINATKQSAAMIPSMIVKVLGHFFVLSAMTDSVSLQINIHQYRS